MHIFMAGSAMLILETRSTLKQAAVITALYKKPCFTVVTLQEPLSERPKSWKARACINSVRTADHEFQAGIELLLYFIKDSNNAVPQFGDRIAFIKSPKVITNEGISGNFDYQSYCAMKNIYFNVFLRPGEYVIIQEAQGNALNELLFQARDWVINVLRDHAKGQKETALAEALLVGYRDDLDKNLEASYSKTGVVHVVAISGLHLGLIYAILKIVCMPFITKKAGRWLALLVVVGGLWMFSLIAGGSPSVLRSAVMFTAIVLGECINKQTSIYNNLAASAFFLLVFNPYWLWDIGFQLSYAALFSIVVFMKPVYHLVTVKNKIVDMVWKLNAVTLAAQVLTLPLCIFHFRQFPVFFLPANLVAVPLSSFALVAEITLCAVTYIEPAAQAVGQLISFLITVMNASVEWIATLPGSTLENLYLNLPQLALVYVLIAAISGWLLRKKTRWLYVALVALNLFLVSRL